MSISALLFTLLIFPGFLFLSTYGTVCEYLDRHWYAKLQNRVGPRFIQPVADIIKLFAKEDITPKTNNIGLAPTKIKIIATITVPI